MLIALWCFQVENHKMLQHNVRIMIFTYKYYIVQMTRNYYENRVGLEYFSL